MTMLAQFWPSLVKIGHVVTKTWVPAFDALG